MQTYLDQQHQFLVIIWQMKFVKLNSAYVQQKKVALREKPYFSGPGIS